MNRDVSLTKRVQTAKGPRYCPVVLSKNGRIQPDAVLIDGKTELHPEGAYYISWDAGKKCIRLSVGKDATDAANQRELKEAQLKAFNKGELPELSDLSQLPR